MNTIFSKGVQQPTAIPSLPQREQGFVMNDNGFPQAYYDVSIMYDTDEGVMQLPVGGNPASTQSLGRCLIVDLYMPVTAITVEWTCGRSGIKPSAPSPKPVDPNWKLLKARVIPKPAQVYADLQRRLFYISGIYAYAAIRPIDVTETPITMSNLPFDLNAAFENRYTPSDFTQVVLDPDRIVTGGIPAVNPKWQVDELGKPIVIPPSFP